VAVAVISTARSRWRWLAVLYPCMTTLAVIVTANHFWMDGIVAAAILALVLAVQALVRRALGRWRAARADSGLAPDLAGSGGELALSAGGEGSGPQAAADRGA